MKTFKKREDGPDRGLNPEPLAPKARIIPLDHQAAYTTLTFIFVFLKVSILSHKTRFDEEDT